MSLSLPALAQSKPGCPPGSWFCAEADVNVTPPPQAQPAPAPERQHRPQIPPPPAAPEVVDDEPVAPVEPAPPPPARHPRRAPPPVVVYQQVPAPPPQVIIITPGYGGYAPPPSRPVRPVPPAPRVKAKQWQSEFGLNLRVEGAILGQTRGTASTAGMGGVGLSLRYRPVPAFAFDLGVDVLAGNDYNGFQRVEVPISLNGLLYLNPRSRVQVYLMGGAHISRAQVRSEFAAPQLSLMDGREYGANYTYFGGQGGGGLEFRLSRRVALNLDALGFVRKRIDDGRTPEFIDYETGRTTNTSGGALVRGGLTFWW